FLFVFALLYVQGPLKWWALILTVISFLLAFGYHTPFFRMAFETLPFFNKFRTPSMALVIAQLIFPFLGLYGLHIFLSQKKFEAKDRQKLLMAFGITGGLALVAGLAGSYVYSYEAESDKQLSEQGLNFLVDALRKDRADMLRTDAVRSILFSAAAFYLLWRFFKQQIEFKWLVPALAAIILVDEWSVSRRYLNEENFVDPSEYDKSFSMTAADMEILRDPDPNFRVYNLTRDPFNDAMTSYYHKHIGGYHAAKLIRYQDLIEEHISKGTPQVINMLNTRYIIQKGSNGQPQVRRNPGALGNAWIVKNIKIVKNADEEIGMLGKEDFSPSETAILDQKFSKLITSTNYNTAQSSVAQTFFSPNKISYSVSSPEKVFVVFSEIFYPEWNCYLDGKLTPYARVNYVLRGLEVSPGNHTIEFKIEPKAYFIGNKIAYAGSALLLLFVFSIAGIHLRPYWQQTSELQKNSSSKKNRQP
ncbi:MAG: hypothetical protein RMJ53_10140, partial [Chitinophagales bacterium]|nr:hypothetical protein [Chitinophagales bacterium]